MDVKKYALLNGFILFLLFFLPVFCRAQITGLKNYTQEDGLNSSFGYVIKQDAKGFIWIGGDNGLFRFDGSEFKQYNEKSGLENIEILGCEPLANGEIFIIPFMGDFGLLKNNKLFTAENNPELKKIQFRNAKNFILANDQRDQLIISVWLNPKFIYIYKNGKISEFPVSSAIVSVDSSAYCIMYDFHNSNLYLINSHEQIISYNIHTRKKTYCDLSLKNNKVILTKGNFLVTRQNDELTVYELTAPFVFEKINTFRISENIYEARIDDTNKLWLYLENGGALYFDQALKDSLTSAKPVVFLKDYIINDVLKDRDGNMWFNTKNNGLFFMPEKVFKNYIHIPLKDNNSYFTAIAANKTSVFLGQNASRGTIYHSGKLTELNLDSNKLECRSIFANEDVAIFGQSKYAYIVNLSDHRVACISNVGNVKNLVPYRTNSVLICGHRFLYEYNFVNHKMDTLLNERIYTALMYDPYNLFIGSFKDLYKFNTITKRKALFLENYYFTDLKKAGPDVYIGATRLSGLLLFNRNGIVRKIAEHEGLASNHVKKIDVENEHTFWVSTSLGLSRISLEGGTAAVQNFTRIDGLPSDLVAGCVVRDDTI